MTTLITKVKDQLPQGDDIYGYQGIDSALIVKSLNESYDMLSLLESHNDTLEVIWLKRNLADRITFCSDFIKEQNTLMDDNSSFNKFLNNVSKIRFSIKETYISLTKQPIYIDSELLKAKDQLDTITQELVEIEEKHVKIDEIYSIAEKLAKDNKTQNEIINNELEKIQGFTETLDEIESDVEDKKKAVSVNTIEVQVVIDNLKKKETEISSLAQSTLQTKKDNESNAALIESHLEDIGTIIKTGKDQQELIQQTIEDANRLGMAGSFKKRKDELRIPLILWTAASILSLLLLTWLSHYLVKELFSKDVTYIYLISKIPIIASAVWLCWFCGKQFGFTSRIREDYSFKYAVSMAFEGYRKVAKEIDDKILEDLINLTILNISQNPINIFDTKNNHGSPYNEMLESFIKKFNKRSNDGIKEED